MREIRFKFRPEKAFAAIHWMVRQRPGLDLHALLKACYFADKAHLNTFGRPIFGATYRAMRFGPVPIEIYEMAKGEALWLSEVQRDRYPWTLEGYRLRLTANDDPERTAATHGPDWQAAELGIMKYEDMLDDTAEKAVIVERLRENGRFMRL
jgi:hypothetical protein